MQTYTEPVPLNTENSPQNIRGYTDIFTVCPFRHFWSAYKVVQIRLFRKPPPPAGRVFLTISLLMFPLLINTLSRDKRKTTLAVRVDFPLHLCVFAVVYIFIITRR